jgi:nitroreductase
MVRNYAPEPVDRETLTRIVSTVRRAPSVAVLAGITIGVPADDSAWSGIASRLTRARRPLDDLVRWERWS